MLERPGEKLAIKTDHPSRWRNRAEKAANDLTPQGEDDSKSSWAHAFSDESGFDALLDGTPAVATRLLQALALFLFHAKADESVLRNRVEGISFERNALSDDVIIDDKDEHVVVRFDETHRSLRTATIEARQECLRTIFQKDAFNDWKYTRQQLIPLLQYLLAKECLRLEYVELARKIVEESR